MMHQNVFKLFVTKMVELCCPQPKLPVLLTRIKEVAKVFLATNSDFNYTEVSRNMNESRFKAPAVLSQLCFLLLHQGHHEIPPGK